MSNPAVTFRPDNLELLFGQDHLKEALRQWLEKPKTTPQSILLWGPYGTGKTTVARMFAKRLASISGDVVEINASACRGIDDVREWIESSRFSPLGTAKVFIIDELHQMTQAAQSALLKVIEEPPRGLYYFLCTTEPSKLLPAIRSRCVQMEFKLLGRQSALELMDLIGSGLVSPEIQEEIFRRSRGHARDIVNAVGSTISGKISSLDQFQKAVGPGSQEVEYILRGVLEGTASRDQLLRLSQFADETLLLKLIEEVVDQSLFLNPKIRSNYKSFLDLRVQVKNHLISAREMLNFFLSILL